MNKRLVVMQNGYKDCGPACLLSVMKYYGFDISLDELSYVLKTDNNGTNAYNIINGSKMFGFDGYGVHYSYEEIINNNIIFPIICHTMKNNMYHFIVVYGIKKNKLEIMDPSSNVNLISKDSFKNIYLNTSIVIYPIKKINSFNKHKPLINFIFEYLMQIKKQIIKSIILSIVIILLGIISNYYFYFLIDKVIPNYHYKTLIIISLLFLIICIIKNIYTYIRQKLLIEIENNVFSKINIDIIRKLFNLPYLFFKSKSTGEVESRLNDIILFKNMFSEIIINLSLDLLFVLFSLIVLIVINYRLLLISFIQIILYFIIVKMFKYIIIKNTEDVLVSEEDYKKVLNDSINAYEINKNLNMINSTIKKIEIKFIHYINKIKKYEGSENKELLFKSLIVDIMFIINVFIGIIFIHNNLISLSKFILFNSILAYFINPFKNILDLNHSIIYLKNVYKRIEYIFMLENKNELLTNNILTGDVVISDLKYYNNYNKLLLKNINLNIKYKDKYLIYGESGSGKTTLMKILLKYIDNYSGDIIINNINLKDINSNTISNNFTYVSQNSFLNSDTFKNNIIDYRDINDEEYEKVIKICNLNDLRNSKELRNDFIIEENGFNISGGEKQKIILARSLLKKSNYYIFDEALSQVDLKEEIDILNKILKTFEDKTIIYISHRKQMLDFFNKKYKIERSGEDNRGL